MKTKLAVMTALAVLACGCTVTRIELGDGTKFSSTRFADLTRIGVLEANLGTNSFRVEGYEGDRQTAAVEAMRAAQMAIELATKAAATVP